MQEAWLRLQRTDATEIRDLRAWLTTVVRRLALDALGSARRRREQYVGPWLPEPLVEDDPANQCRSTRASPPRCWSCSSSSSPAERTAFVLHDIFGLPFTAVADVVGRDPAAVRQLASRARAHVKDGTPRFPASRDEHEQLVTAFAAASRAGDVAALMRVLDPAVTFRADGGGKAIAARRPIDGAARVARVLTKLARNTWRDVHVSLVNDMPGLLVDDGASAPSVYSVTVDAGRIVAIDVTRNPDKLQHVRSSSPNRSTSGWEAAA